MADSPSALSATTIRALRGAKPAADPWAEPPWNLERERRLAGGTRAALTVFLTGAECPYTCVFCDLWQHTLDEATPPGALPEQLRRVLERQTSPPEPDACLKLYNASNFFEPRAVPEIDDEALARLAEPFDRVVVECHPKLVGERCRHFAERLAGRQDGRLEVAMGFESVHPRALPRLGKGATRGDLERAAGRLERFGVGLRAFVLVGAPYVPEPERMPSVLDTVRFALELGARHVSLIPVRGGNGALEVLAGRGEWRAPTVGEIEEALDRSLELAGAAAVVAADPWDLERLATCPECAGTRRERIERIGLTGRTEPRIECARCGEGEPVEQR